MVGTLDFKDQVKICSKAPAKVRSVNTEQKVLIAAD